MVSSSPTIFVSAGEVSGDRLGAPVLEELRGRFPGLRALGLGGERLEAAGLERWRDQGRLAVAGLTEAIGALPAAAKVAGRLMALLFHRGHRPDLALLVDSPGLNLRLAWLCRRAGVPVVQVVAPQRWAWLSWRVGALAKLVDGLAVTLPFEEAWFRDRGVAATFVGHPLMDRRGGLPGRPSGAGRGTRLGLFPGSRGHEIERHLPLLRGAAARLGDRVAPLVAVASEDMGRLCESIAPELPRASAAEVLASAQVALCASGTATLELALADVPQVVLYRLSPLSAYAARHLLSVRYVALPNLLLDRPLVPELLQGEATVRALAEAAAGLIDSDSARALQREGYREVEALLGPAGFAARVADLCEPLLRGSGR